MRKNIRFKIRFQGFLFLGNSVCESYEQRKPACPPGRREDFRFNGQGQYTADMVLTSALHAAFVRSAIARGHLRIYLLRWHEGPRCCGTF